LIQNIINLLYFWIPAFACPTKPDLPDGRQAEMPLSSLLFF